MRKQLPGLLVGIALGCLIYRLLGIHHPGLLGIACLIIAIVVILLSTRDR